MLTGKLSPYKSQRNNILEALYLLNLFIIFTSTIALHKTTSEIIINVSVLLAMFKLLFILLLHVKNCFCNAC